MPQPKRCAGEHGFCLPRLPDSNQNGVVTTTPFDIKARAHQAMLEAGFQPDFTAEVTREVQALNQGAPKNATPAARDLRSLLWSSIDNDSSRDLDQVEYVDKLPDGTVRLLVGIADVDASVPKGSATDQHAAVESTSVYTGVATFPMLPAELSTDLTSLLDAQDRLSIIIELRILDSGDVKAHDVYPAWLRNRAKLAYSSTGAWLEGRAPIPPAVANVPGMEAQLRQQQETSESLRGIRKQHGALTFESVETTPVLQNGEVKDLAVSRRTVADEIIESFMVVRGTRGIDVGDTVRVRLASVNVAKGFIDFERM
jgi:exoribonuclease-2